MLDVESLLGATLESLGLLPSDYSIIENDGEATNPAGWDASSHDMSWEAELDATRAITAISLTPRGFHLLGLPINVNRPRILLLYGEAAESVSEVVPRGHHLEEIHTDQHNLGGLAFTFEYRGPLQNLVFVTLRRR